MALEIIKGICLVIGAVWFIVVIFGSLLILGINIMTWLDNKHKNRMNKKNGNLRITVDQSWKEKMK